MSEALGFSGYLKFNSPSVNSFPHKPCGAFDVMQWCCDIHTRIYLYYTESVCVTVCLYPRILFVGDCKSKSTVVLSTTGSVSRSKQLLQQTFTHNPCYWVILTINNVSNDKLCMERRFYTKGVFIRFYTYTYICINMYIWVLNDWLVQIVKPSYWAHYGEQTEGNGSRNSSALQTHSRLPAQCPPPAEQERALPGRRRALCCSLWVLGAPRTQTLRKSSRRSALELSFSAGLRFCNWISFD